MKNRKSLTRYAALFIILAALLFSSARAVAEFVLLPADEAAGAPVKWHPTAAPSASVVYTETLEQLEEISDCVVLGSFSDDAVIHFPKENAISSRFGFEIEKVFKGELKQGDKIKISQPYHYVRNGEGYTAVCVYPYYPSEQGRRYIFFLQYSERDRYYYPSASYKGRYSVPREGETADTPLRQAIRELGVTGYDSLCDEVYGKYLPLT